MPRHPGKKKTPTKDVHRKLVKAVKRQARGIAVATGAHELDFDNAVRQRRLARQQKTLTQTAARNRGKGFLSKKGSTSGVKKAARKLGAGLAGTIGGKPKFGKTLLQKTGTGPARARAKQIKRLTPKPLAKSAARGARLGASVGRPSKIKRTRKRQPNKRR